MQLKEILAKCRDKNLFFSTNVQAEIATSELIFISLNTPTKTAGLGAGLAADTSAIEGATRMIAQYSSSSKIVVEKSTVPVKTAETGRPTIDAKVLPGEHKQKQLTQLVQATDTTLSACLMSLSHFSKIGSAICLLA